VLTTVDEALLDVMELDGVGVTEDDEDEGLEVLVVLENEGNAELLLDDET